MKPEIKTKWIAALRSGEYQQVQQDLHNDEGYCCLGVLQSVLAQELIELPADDGDSFLKVEPCLELTGLTFTDQKTLWRMNDDDEKSFDEIADYIEQNL